MYFSNEVYSTFDKHIRTTHRNYGVASSHRQNVGTRYHRAAAGLVHLCLDSVNHLKSSSRIRISKCILFAINGGCWVEKNRSITPLHIKITNPQGRIKLAT